MKQGLVGKWFIKEVLPGETGQGVEGQDREKDEVGSGALLGKYLRGGGSHRNSGGQVMPKDWVGFYTCTPSITGSEGRECKLQEPVAQNQSSKNELQMLPGTELRNEKRGL